MDWVESLIALNFIEDVESYETLEDKTLRKFLEDESKESKEVLSMDILDDIVSKELRTNMSDRNAKSRMRNLFVSYRTILRRHGIEWILEDNEKVAVKHVLSAIRPNTLRQRLESDLEFAYHSLKKDFTGFMDHAIKLAEAFQLVDNGKPKGNKDDDRDNGGKKKSGKNRGPKKDQSDDDDKSNDKKTPLCLHPPCRKKGLRHYMRDCTATSSEEKKALLKALAEEKAKTGPSKSTRSQTRQQSPPDKDSSSTKTTGRLNRKVKLDLSNPSFTITAMDGKESISGKGRADDGSDETIASSKFATNCVLNGVGKFSKIQPIKIQVALKDDSEAKIFNFSKVWTVPRIVLRLTTGPLALVNVTFLIPDDELAAEDVLLGLPLLQHLGIDTKTMLEQNRDNLDGADCSAILPSLSQEGIGKVGRLMIARLNRQRGDEPSTMHSTDSRPRVNYFEVREEEDPFPDSSLLDPIDNSQHGDIEVELHNMIERARGNGLDDKQTQQLSDVVNEFKDIFRTSFSRGPPANVEPLKIELTPDAKPVRVRLRNYSLDQREFLQKFMKVLIDTGHVYPNPTSKWASAPLLVAKPGPSMYRFTVDLRPVNKYTIKYHYPMPHIEQELTKTQGSKVFCEVDFLHGYWQLPLAEKSQELMSIITPDGIMTPTRVPHGTTNATAHMQAQITKSIPEDLRAHVLSWVDDVLIHAKTFDELLGAIRRLFQVFVQLNFKLHPAKCNLFTKFVRWCGRIISEHGITFDPKRIDGLRGMETPSNGAQLQQFVCAMQWMRSAIPKFSELIKPLLDCMERVFQTAKKRTKRATACIKLIDVGWSNIEQTAFDSCKRALETQVTLAHHDVQKRLCVYTDACDTVWSGVITQVPYEDLSKDHADQRHDPLAFLSGHFTGSQLGWSTLEKEASAVMATTERMHWLLATPDGFDLYTDHHNLIFLFDPLAVVPDLSISSTRKVLRWAVRLSMYNYTCVHIKGTDNVWADIIGRWTQPSTMRRIVKIPELPSSDNTEFSWPTPTEIAEQQTAHADLRPRDLRLENGLWVNDSGSTWIPDDSSDLQTRLLIIAHTGPSGHRGATSTESTLKKYYFWSTLSADTKAFLSACIHCLSTTGGKKVPRPFGPAAHGTKPNDLLQFDYIEIAPGHNNEKYVLMLRDDHSNYAWFFSTADTCAEQAATAIIDWCAAFGVPKMLMSDGPTHFKNETLSRLAKGLRVPHHFTLPYTPWSNGGIERLGKEMLRVFRSVISEYQMRPVEWVDLLPMVQHALNNAPSPQRRNTAPVTAFAGLDPSPPISTFYRSSTQTIVEVDDVHRERIMNIESLRARMEELHPVIHEAVERNRRSNRQANSKGVLPNFMEGDFVLVARDEFTVGEKLQLRWRGPRRIVKALSDYVFQVEDLRTGDYEDIHGSRLKFYHDASLDTNAIMSHVLSSETGMVVQRLLELVESPDGLKVRIRWKGLPASEDTEEPIKNVYEDVPVLLEKLLKRKNTPAHLADKARRVLGL